MLILYLIWKTGSFFCAPTCWTQVTCTQLVIMAKDPRLHHAAGKVGHQTVLSFVSHLFPVNQHSQNRFSKLHTKSTGRSKPRPLLSSLILILPTCWTKTHFEKTGVHQVF